MKKKILVALLIVVLFSMSTTAYYKSETVKNYLCYRIKFIHSKAYNTSVNLNKERVQAYAEKIIYWSDYYSRKLGVDIAPLLAAAIMESETNFVSRDDYDNGESIGISSMKVNTAKWIANRLGIDYNKWRMLDATDLGIRFTVYYLGLAYKKYNGNLHKVILGYNLGIKHNRLKGKDKFADKYLFKVLGRYRYYKNQINLIDGSAAEYYRQQFNKLFD